MPHSKRGQARLVAVALARTDAFEHLWKEVCVMKFLNKFGSKKRSPNLDIPKEIQEALRAKMQEFKDAKATGCPYRPFSKQVDFCNRPLLEGSNLCFWHTPNTAKYDPQVMKKYFGDSRTLKEAIEKEVAGGASLAGAYLVNAAIGGNWFERGVNLSGARLEFANLSGAHVSYASLKGASVVGAKLENTYLSDADIRDANFSHACLYNAKFRGNDFTGVKGLTKESFRGWKWEFLPEHRILEEYPDQSVEVYRSLVSYFTAKAALDDASWAAYRGHLAQRQLLKQSLSPITPVVQTLIQSHFVPGETTNIERLTLLSYLRRASTIFALFSSYISCYTFGYGEKPFRVVFVAGLVITVYAALFNWLHAISEPGFWNALYFSTVTFTTLGYGDLAPRREFRLLAASEALVGVVLIGLFLFTLSRRAVGRG